MLLDSQSHLISVIGGKGGVGKSVFAANLAMTLIKELKTSVLLVDFDEKSCGDQNIITGLKPLKTVQDVAMHTGPINNYNISELCTKHPSGLHYIPAVLSPDQSMSVDAGSFLKQLSTLSQFFKYIVVDLGSLLTDNQLLIAQESHLISMVTSPEVLAINQTRKMINELLSATIPAELIHVVLNKVSKNSLNAQAISQSLKRPVLGAIPYDETTTFSAIQKSTPFVLTAPNTPITAAYNSIARKITGGLIQKLKTFQDQNPNQQKSVLDASNAVVHNGIKVSPLNLLKMKIHKALISEMDLKKDLSNSEGDPRKEQEIRNKTKLVVSQLTDKFAKNISKDERAKVIKQVLDEALGLGALEELLEDKSVSEIMVNGADNVYMEKNGKVVLSPVTFTSNQQLRNIIERIVTPLGRRIDEKTPYVDARLADGSRVNAVIEPLSIDGPSLTIRKFPAERIEMSDFTDRFHSLTKPMAEFLNICVEQGLNIIISGGTGSGKTTLLNVLSGCIPANERIITVEDAAELQLKQEHVVRLETRPANMEGTGAVTIRDLIRNTLRMRPDRIIVGETRDGAALDMLSAMNTGHDGSMTTVHSNNPREAIARLETLCMMAGMELPVRAIREQIAGAVDIIIQQSRLSDGSRKITYITEVVGMQGEAVTLQDIFKFKETGFDKNRKIIGQFQALGNIPTFIERFEQQGLVIPRNLFTTQATPEAQVKKRPSRPTPLANRKTAITNPTSAHTTVNKVKKKVVGS